MDLSPSRIAAIGRRYDGLPLTLAKTHAVVGCGDLDHAAIRALAVGTGILFGVKAMLPLGTADGRL